MALKDKAKNADAASTGNGASQEGAQAASTASTPKRRGRQPGTTNNPLIWSDERKMALAEVLRDPSLGSVKTAASVTKALAERPEFAGENVKPQQVASFVKTALKRDEEEGRKAAERGETFKPLAPWFKLDSARQAKGDLSMFKA